MRARAVRDDVGVDAVGAASAPAGRGLTSSSTPRKLAADDAAGSSTPTASSGTADAHGAYDVAPGRTVRTGGSASTSLRAHAGAAPSAGGGSAVAPAHAHEDDNDSTALLQEGGRLEVDTESVRGDDHRLGVRRTAGCGAVVAAGAIGLLTALALIRLHAGHADTVLVHDPALVADAAGARDVWKPFCGSDGTCAGISALETVWWWAWLTAVSTGVGVLPLLFARSIPDTFLAASNAIAAGMMFSASVSLLWEGVQTSAHTDAAAAASSSLLASLLSALPTVMGCGGGLLFVILSQHVLESYEHLKFEGFDGLSARRMLLVLTVMTCHSFSEGVALGVAFGAPPPAAQAASPSGAGNVSPGAPSLGVVITSTLLLHNVPEGLAVCCVMAPRGVHWLSAAVWAVVTSLPQPLMALPAFMFVQRFLTLLPLGLGFAGGAMAWVAGAELLPEAAAIIGRRRAFAVALCAAALMASVRIFL